MIFSDGYRKALQIRMKYNAMPFADFMRDYEQYSGKVYSGEDKTWFASLGLANTDFFMIADTLTDINNDRKT